MINEQELNEIIETIREQPIDESSVTKLRETYPKIHFTLCTEDDITSGSPVFEGEKFDLYAVDSSDHCSVLTQDLNKATGLVIAELLDY